MTSDRRTFDYELRIGVTGHRTLSDKDRVRSCVESVLGHIEHTLIAQGRTPLKWTVISPLALGADRIVAEQVLTRNGARLEVILPFPLDWYLRDFAPGDDRDAFESLFSHRSREICLGTNSPPPSVDQETLLEWQRRGYARAGRAVVDASEIMFAVWNGKDARGAGGTAEIVTYALERHRLVIWIDTERLSNPPCVLRRLERSPSGELIPHTSPLPQEAHALSPGYCQLEMFNRDDSIPLQLLATAQAQVEQKLSSVAAACGIDEKQLGAVVSQLLPPYVRADQLAIRYRNLYIRSTCSLFALSAVAVTVVVAQTQFFPDQHWLLLLEILAMCSAVALWQWCGRAGWHEKWLHNRYLAERLRTRLFVSLIDRKRDESDPNTVLPFYHGPQQWVMDIINAVGTSVNEVQLGSFSCTSLRRFLVDSWLDDQQRYHQANAASKHRKSERGHRAGTACFVLTILIACLHLAGIGHGSHDEAPLLSADRWLTCLAIALPAWGAAIHAITTQLELERIATRSRCMASVLGTLAARTTDAQTTDELRTIAADAERILSVELHEWWALLSFRRPILPT